jgi:glycosyltransferase involved in cell wall biosynthesis
MNILMLGRWVPPPRRPIRLTREYQFARHLTRGHRLTLAFITDSSDIAGSISALRSEFGDLEFATVPRAWKSLAGALSLATGESCTLSYFRSEALRTRLADRLRRARYDLVFVSSSNMIQYALDADPTIPLVVDFGELESEWWLRQAVRGGLGAARFFRTEASRLRQAETAAARRAAACVAGTPEAVKLVTALGAVAPTSLIPNGIDMESFGPTPRLGKVPTVVFNVSPGGGPDVTPAIEFFRDVVPAVRARIPAARFVVSRAEGLAVERMLSRLDVEMVAPSTDLRAILHSHTVAAAPLRGGDPRSSVLEPMASGVPVVTTSQMCGQIGARVGRDLQAADGAGDFAKRVVELLESPGLRGELGVRGREFVAGAFSWEIFASRLGDVLTKVVPGAAPAGPESAPRPIEATLGG